MGSLKRVGILTNGGDCPGLNPGIVGVVEELESRGVHPLGVRFGFEGLRQLSENGVSDEWLTDLRGIARSRWMHEGGTMLGASRTSIHEGVDIKSQAVAGVESAKLDGLVVFGGDGSLWGAHLLNKAGVPTVGVPKTIDKDVMGTEETIGYATAVEVGCEIVERIRTTAESHRLTFVVEVMGRRSGFLAAGVALAAGADGLLVAESSPKFKDVLAWSGRNEGSRGAVVVMAEGCWFDDLDIPENLKDHKGRMRLGWAAQQLETELAARGVGVRSIRLGHTLRGGRPVAQDRILAHGLGQVAGASLKKSGIAVVRGGKYGLRPFGKSLKEKKIMDREDLNEVSSLLL